jgi:hypothetical protein
VGDHCSRNRKALEGLYRPAGLSETVADKLARLRRVVNVLYYYGASEREAFALASCLEFLKLWGNAC